MDSRKLWTVAAQLLLSRHHATTSALNFSYLLKKMKNEIKMNKMHQVID
jgi:hypothetical protein